MGVLRVVRWYEKGFLNSYYNYKERIRIKKEMK